MSIKKLFSGLVKRIWPHKCHFVQYALSVNPHGTVTKEVCHCGLHRTTIKYAAVATEDEVWYFREDKKMTNRYEVRVPVVAVMTIGVDADSPDEAVDAVMTGDITLTMTDQSDRYNFLEIEWDMYEKVVEGNVYHGPINNIHVDLVDDEEEDF